LEVLDLPARGWDLAPNVSAFGVRGLSAPEEGFDALGLSDWGARDLPAPDDDLEPPGLWDFPELLLSRLILLKNLGKDTVFWVEAVSGGWWIVIGDWLMQRQVLGERVEVLG